MSVEGQREQQNWNRFIYQKKLPVPIRVCTGIIT
jgi:hypothetical protein